MSVPAEKLEQRIIVPIEPMAAVRMTQRGKWVEGSAQRYISHKAQVGYYLRKQWPTPTDAACAVGVTFYMPIPQSLSKVKQRALIGKPHTKKPDIDNLIKSLFDSANGIIWKDDNQVVSVRAEKRYGEVPRIEVEIRELF